MSKMYSLKEAAAFLGVSYRTIRRYLKSGLPYSESKGDKGIEYRLKEVDLVEFKKARLERPKQGATLRGIFGRTQAESYAGDQKDYLRTERTKLDASQTSDSLDTKLIEKLESENDFLKEQIAFKDKQLTDYHSVIRRLTHQNEILTMICQGVEPELLMKSGGAAQQDGSARIVEKADSPAQQQAKPPLTKAEIIAETKRLHKAGKSAEEIRQFVVRCGYASFSDLLKNLKKEQKEAAEGSKVLDD